MTGWGWRGRAAVLLTAATLAAGCEVKAGDGDFSFEFAAGKAADTWTRSYELSPGGRLEIINVNGQIHAEATTGPTVEVTAERSASAASDDDARRLLEAVQMREEVGAGRVRIETVAPTLKLGGHKVMYRVRVPAGVHVDLRTVNGGVRLDNVGGEVRASSTNGGVKGTLSGASLIDARTTNGGVELAVTGPLSEDGEVRLSSVNGGVRLSVPAATRAAVSARCVNGRVTVNDLELSADGEQTRRRVAGTLNGGGARIDLQTTNGGVTIGRS